jgi:uncharacterized protein
VATRSEWLLDHGVAVNATDHYGHTALHLVSTATSGNTSAMAQLLLDSGADVHIQSKGGLTVLDSAAFTGNLECAKVLIAAGADVNHSDNTGKYTCLHEAITHNHSAIVQLLLENGATAVINRIVPAPCSHGTVDMTALMMCGEADTVKLLLAAGADVSVSTDVGETCLHIAARRQCKAPVLCLLIKAGADIHAVNNRGKTAAQVAHHLGHTLIEQLLNRAAQQKQ